MEGAAQLEMERAELNALLDAGVFHRAKNLASFLQYVCDRYFEGEADQLKEYNIAVEALGRPPDFDQKKDSIVRVEAHRLRKRLSEFYASEGASHAIQISIPNGQYAPVFMRSEVSTPGVNGVPVAPPGEAASETVAVVEEPPRASKTWLVLALSLAAIVAAGLAVRWAVNRQRNNEVWVGQNAPVAVEYRFLAGYRGNSYHDRQGREWQPDAYYSGGRSVQVAGPGKTFEGVPDPGFLHTKREGTFRYDIPVRKGTYEAHLYFAETQGNAIGSRVFNIVINGRQVTDGLDVASEAGALNRLHERVFRDVRPGTDGKVHLEFAPISGPAMLNAAELLPSTEGRIRPVRVVTSESSVVDADGQEWSADQYFIGGLLVAREESVKGTPSKTLFEGERYGNFVYRIPVAPGKYKVTLVFAETYFGSLAFNFPKGERRFNVFANGVALLKNFDVVSEAGGPGRAIKRTFENIEANAQGLIVLEFTPIQNYAEVNAIEVVQMP